MSLKSFFGSPLSLSNRMCGLSLGVSNGYRHALHISNSGESGPEMARQNGLNMPQVSSDSSKTSCSVIEDTR